MRDDDDAVLGEVLVPAGVISVKVRVDQYFTGNGEIALMAALILSESGANWPSTMMMPSAPTAT